MKKHSKAKLSDYEEENIKKEKSAKEFITKELIILSYISSTALILAGFLLCRISDPWQYVIIGLLWSLCTISTVYANKDNEEVGTVILVTIAALCSVVGLFAMWSFKFDWHLE
jgi:hypothetical protein